MLADFRVTIDYGQVLVCTQDRAAAGLLWTDDHVAQGFAWSPGHVAFGVPDHDGECRIQVELGQGVVLDPLALWAVQVPFMVDAPVQVGALFEPRSVAVPRGNWQLGFQALPGSGGDAYVLRLTFAPDDSAQFRILKKGGDISADTVLRRDAQPAS